MRQVLGGGALVAEQAQVPVGVAERLGGLAEGQQAAVGVGRVGEPAEHDGQQRALDGGAAADAGGQRGQVPQRAGRVGEAQGLQPGLGGLGREVRRAECGGARREAGDGVEQRPVEQLLVQAPDFALVPLPLRAELVDGVGAVAERAAEAAQVGLVLREGVGAAETVDLEAVLQGSQEPVGVGQGGGVGAPDVAAGRQGAQRLQGAAVAQGGVGGPVDELEQLDGELDVAQAAGAELELALGLLGRDVLDDAATHGLHVGDEAVAARGGPHHRGQGLDVLPGQLLVPGGRAGLEQRLELPGLGPALVVRDVARQGAHQRAVLALRAQVRVDLPDGALDGRVRSTPASWSWPAASPCAARRARRRARRPARRRVRRRRRRRRRR